VEAGEVEEEVLRLHGVGFVGFVGVDFEMSGSEIYIRIHIRIRIQIENGGGVGGVGNDDDFV